MSKSNLYKEVQAEALQLSVEELATLALTLIQSLDAKMSPVSDDWRAAWLAECERRLNALESGEQRGVALEDVPQRARSQLK